MLAQEWLNANVSGQKLRCNVNKLFCLEISPAVTPNFQIRHHLSR